MESQHETSRLSSIHALLVDDHTLFSLGIREMLTGKIPGASVDTADSAASARDLLDTKGFDFLLLDYLIPGTNVEEFLQEVRTRYPDIRILIVSGLSDASIIKRCFSLGANGFLSKSINYSEFLTALERTYSGSKYISSDLIDLFTNGPEREDEQALTKKEQEILQLVARGKTVKSIAIELGISPSTVMSHRTNIMRKINARTTAEMIKYAFERRIV